ncbi:hypothetical protein K461DRAFT_65386 [Myriangium duriaei CBS 260.36]|uniref:Uncharacterized protein n=1 Tax=Myriangium duriaei CBS 260.36 TaxID=1168546 RepID=A0A9P4MCT1_9PEZI|nr:hypothetical protein K461DRAFT_65386 [Myriangium duriaei CBS 260.36]
MHYFGHLDFTRLHRLWMLRRRNNEHTRPSCNNLDHAERPVSEVISHVLPCCATRPQAAPGEAQVEGNLPCRRYDHDQSIPSTENGLHNQRVHSLPSKPNFGRLLAGIPPGDVGSERCLMQAKVELQTERTHMPAQELPPRHFFLAWHHIVPQVQSDKSHLSRGYMISLADPHGVRSYYALIKTSSHTTCRSKEREGGEPATCH